MFAELDRLEAEEQAIKKTIHLLGARNLDQKTAQVIVACTRALKVLEDKKTQHMVGSV